MKNPRSFHIALTGHRPHRLPGGFDLAHPFYAALRRQLSEIVDEHLQEHAHLTLHSGMALGADTAWAQVILDLRHQHPRRISFVAEVPNPTQADRWSASDRRRWSRSIDEADRVITYADNYSMQSLWARNRGMIDAAQLLIAVWDGQPGGGTAGAVAYAQSRGVTVVRLDPAEIAGS